ncbi:hypothetical protein ABFA25_03570 [Mycobacterium lepromatosis]|nr:hypothetical protein [Mycobacterium lepromatosis]
MTPVQTSITASNMVLTAITKINCHESMLTQSLLITSIEKAVYTTSRMEPQSTALNKGA